MTDFKDLQKQWTERSIPQPSENDFNNILKKSKSIRKKQWIGQIVLITTALILIGFFFYITAYNNTQVFIGLGIMIGSLLLRIGLESLYIIKKTHLSSDKDMKSYTKELIQFYRRRKLLHFLVTPMLFVSYILGFQLLLPYFKLVFSDGFYIYIVVSSWVIFAALAVLIGSQIWKELKLIKELIKS